MNEFMKVVNYVTNKHSYLINNKKHKNKIIYELIIEFLMSHNIQFMNDESNEYIEYNSIQVQNNWDEFSKWISKQAFKKTF